MLIKTIFSGFGGQGVIMMGYLSGHGRNVRRERM